MDIVLSLTSKTDDSVQTFNYPLNGRLLLGRGPDSPVPLDGPGISRDHLAIQVEDSGLVLTDLSANGTWVNGTRLSSNRKQKITEADSIEVPGYEIRIRTAGAPLVRPKSVGGESEAKPKANSSPLLVIGQSTWLERFLILVGVACLVLLLLYLNS